MPAVRVGRKGGARGELLETELAHTHWFGRLTGQQVLLLRTGAAHDEAALPTVVPAVDGGEFHLLAAHAHGRLRVGHPDRRVLAGGRFSAFFQQVRNTLADVAHPL